MCRGVLRPLRNVFCFPLFLSSLVASLGGGLRACASRWLCTLGGWYHFPPYARASHRAWGAWCAAPSHSLDNFFVMQFFDICCKKFYFFEMSKTPMYTDIFSAYEMLRTRVKEDARSAKLMQRALDNASDLAFEYQNKCVDLRSENEELRATIAYLTPTVHELQNENFELQNENFHLKNCAAWAEPTLNKALKRIRELEVENLSMDWVLLPTEPVEESPKTPSRQSDPMMPPAPRKRARTARMRTGGLNAQTLRRINSQTQDE